jgi:hypothetical protein
MIADVVQAHARRLKRDVERDEVWFKTLIDMLYVQAVEIKDGTVSAFNTDVKMPGLDSYYPDLFSSHEAEEDAETNAPEVRKPSKEDLLLAAQKAAMEEVVYYQNRFFRAKHKADPEVTHDTTGTQGTHSSTDEAVQGRHEGSPERHSEDDGRREELHVEDGGVSEEERRERQDLDGQGHGLRQELHNEGERGDEEGPGGGQIIH